MDPINYSSFLTPAPPVTAPLDALQNEQVQSAQRAYAAQQVQQQQRTLALQNAALQTALQSPTAQNYRNLLLVNPGAHEAIKAGMDSLDESGQRQTLQDLTAFTGYLQNKQPDQAKAVLQRHIDAGKTAGQDTSNYQQLLDHIDNDPDGALHIGRVLLAGSVGADKLATNEHLFGEESRAAQAEPGKEALTSAQTAQALAEANAKTNPPPKTAVNSFTGQYYNENAAPPAAAATSNNGALDGFVQRLQASENATGNAGAKNPASSATGNGQFLNGTWVPLISQLHPELVQGKSQQDILDLRKIPQLAAEATTAYAQQNAQALGTAGLPVNGATLAMAHRLGPQGAQAVLQAKPDAPLSSILPADVIKANPQYAKMTAGQLGQKLAGDFGTTPIDTTPGDPTATGDAYLKTLDPARARMVKAVADGDQDLSVAGRAGPARAILAQQVEQYDPTASAINLPARKANRIAFTSGKQGQQIVQASTSAGHLAAIDGLVDGLNNGSIPIANAIAQGVQTATGDVAKQKALANFNTLKGTLALELTKFYGSGNGGTEGEVKAFLKQLDPTKSPAELHAVTKQMASAMLSKISALNESYSAGMGKSTDTLNLPKVNFNAVGRLQQLAGESAFSNVDGGGAPQASTPQVYVNQKGERIAYDAASKSWKPVS